MTKIQVKARKAAWQLALDEGRVLRVYGAMFAGRQAMTLTAYATVTACLEAHRALLEDGQQVEHVSLKGAV